MVGHTLEVLELDKLKQLLSRYASSDLARAHIQELHPFTDVAHIRYLLDLCTEAREVCLTSNAFDFDGLTDIRPILDRAARIGAILEPEDLLRVGAVARCARRVRGAMARYEHLPLLQDLIASLPTFPEFEERLAECLSPDGEILDHASPELRRIRRQLQSTRAHIRSQLERILKQPQYQKAIQDAVITLRNDRFVIPIRQDYRGEIPGVVQGQSSSGATLFLEPLTVVEANNALHRLALAERHEIRRILQALTDDLRPLIPAFQAALDTLGELDFLIAKARLSLDLQCTAPELNTDGRLRLIRARHPLLEMQLREHPPQDPDQPQTVVPTDIHLGDDFTMLVITGPNTGGKTVVLKTVGLLTLMAQCGLHIPAGDGSEIGVFEQIFADIGDEQSIEQNLSTFSSHMSQIIQILKCADERSLVLLDELGAGTDPIEGTALGMAIMDALRLRNARTIITTHYGALKAHAHTSPGVENASMEFDWQTLRPTYRLRIGVPGSSNALRIAERLGLDPSVIQVAQQYMRSEYVAVEDLIASIERERKQLEADQERLQALIREAEAKERLYRERLEQFEAERAQLQERAEKEAAEIIASARKLIENTVAEIRQSQASRESIRRAHEQVRQRETELKQRQKQRAQKRRKRPQVKPGDKVKLKTLGRVAEVVGVDTGGRQAQVQLGKLQLTVDTADLERVEASLNRPKLSASVVDLQYAKRATVPGKLHLLGLPADEAVKKIDKYLDDAYLAGLSSVTLVHGKGTGALAAATEQLLREHPQVKHFRRGHLHEGGDGVTIVTLKE